MEKNIKKIPLFVIVLLSLILFYPMGSSALSEKTSYVSINNSEDLSVGNLSFYDMVFKDYSLTSTQAFGLVGKVINYSSEPIDYTLNVYYYGRKYSDLIAEDHISGRATPGTNNFNLMSNLGILNEYKSEDIYSYRLSVDTNDNSPLDMDIESTTPSRNKQYSSYEYVIDKYDVNIIVNENNILDITEKITAFFNVPKHGIFRTIPLSNTITRLDGTTSKNRTQITNLSVDNEYTTSKVNGNYKIQIGSASKTLTGEQTYVIKYTYNLGKDSVKSYDELYFNIIGDDWDTVIGNITFTIEMPKEFDASKLGFSSGARESVDNSKVRYNVSGNKITGSYDGILKVKNALTVRCELDEGYFVGAGINVNVADYIMLLIPIVFLVIAVIIWYIFGRDDQVIETVEFYPPEGFNSLEVGFLYKGVADKQDVTSLLIYLANKGYIKITEIEEKSLFSKIKGFKITKLKDYDGNNINERIFLNGLFIRHLKITSSFSEENDDTENNLEEVTSFDLYNNFYIIMNKILHNINNKENKNKIFEALAPSKSIFIVLMIMATYFLITIPPLFAAGQTFNLFIALLFPGLGFSVMFGILFQRNQTIYINGKPSKSPIVIRAFGLIWGCLFGGMPFVFTVLPSLLQDPIYLIGYIVGLVCVLGMVIVLIYLPKRTPYGNEVLGKLRGFKNFLETAEKDKLEAMVMDNPTYFYDILPYTYVLGVSDKWIKKFEAIALQAPDWYDSPSAFDVVSFGTFMNTTMVSAQSVMSSSPSSSAGSSSGGGSSGGGSGGGGGGSW